jgi:probable FeS assembly SUF system protein SufT
MQMESETVKFTRDCEVIQVPSGVRMTVKEGTNALITQDLGGTYTLVTSNGEMVRVTGRDADAIGKSVPDLPAAAIVGNADDPEELEEAVWDQLRTCYDPEIPINIADLGLVYRCEVVPLDEGGNRVEIDMTLTAPACGMGDVLKAEVEQKVAELPGVKELDVQLVLDPPWDYSMIPDAAKLTLGMM